MWHLSCNRREHGGLSSNEQQQQAYKKNVSATGACLYLGLVKLLLPITLGTYYSKHDDINIATKVYTAPIKRVPGTCHGMPWFT